MTASVETLQAEVNGLKTVESKTKSMLDQIVEVQGVIARNITRDVGSAPRVLPSAPIDRTQDAMTGQGGVQTTRKEVSPKQESLSEVVSHLKQTLQDVTSRLENPDMTPDAHQPTAMHGDSGGVDDTPHIHLPEDRQFSDDLLRPVYEGLEPLKTLQTPFVKVMSYRTYRLPDTRVTLGPNPRVNKRAKELRDSFPHLTNFSGRQPVKLLSFLQQFKAACILSDIHEGLAVRVISFFLEGDAHRFYVTETTTGLRRRGLTIQQLAWPVLVHRLLKRFCTEDALAKAHDKVTRASKEIKRQSKTLPTGSKRQP